MRIRHKVSKDHKPVPKSPRDDLDEDEQVLHDAYSKYDDSQLFNLTVIADFSQCVVH